MLELIIPLILATSCDITSVALGSCGCPGGSAGEFSLCAGEESTSREREANSGSGEQAMELCQFYANGTIDIPTITIIEAWVPLNSRLCLGDEVTAGSAPRVKSVSEQLEDRLTAISNRPYAWWEPGGEIEFDDPARFLVSGNDLDFEGELLGKTAQIRFRATNARWEFSDGASQSGFEIAKSFADIGDYRAQAFVRYSVDYKISGSQWVVGAASWELESNTLSVKVIELPRRTLLVD